MFNLARPSPSGIMNKRILTLSALLGALAVVLGAFGAHALKSMISPEALENWKTAVNYQFIHVLALFGLSLMPENRLVKAASWCFGLGILFFSGSLYLLSLREIADLPLSVLGPITPLGGLLFIVAWFLLFLLGLKKN